MYRINVIKNIINKKINFLLKNKPKNQSLYPKPLTYTEFKKKINQK